MALSKSEVIKRHREKMKKNSLCVNCGKPLDRVGSLCEKCREQHTANSREVREFYKQHGLCPRCGKNKLIGDEKNCLECSAYGYEVTMRSRRSKGVEHYNKAHADWARKEHAKRLENGICTRCGKRKADYGYKTCGICREKMRNQKRKKSIGTKRNEWVEKGLCYFCGEPVKPGYKVCEKHYQTALESLDNPKCKEATAKMKKDNNKFFLRRN